jgi:hypothetical protein
LLISLAECCARQGALLGLRSEQGETESATAYQRAAAIYKQLVASGRKDVLPKLLFLQEKEELSARISSPSNAASAGIEVEITTLERRVHINGEVELAPDLAELYLERLVRLAESGASSERIREEFLNSSRLCNDLADAVILGERNDLFEQLYGYQSKLQQIARQRGAVG